MHRIGKTVRRLEHCVEVFDILRGEFLLLNQTTQGIALPVFQLSGCP